MFPHEPTYCRQGSGKVFDVARWRSTRSSCTATHYCDPGSHVPGREQRVLPEEPTGVIPCGGVCEGRGQPKAPRPTYTGTKPETADTDKERLQWFARFLSYSALNVGLHAATDNYSPHRSLTGLAFVTCVRSASPNRQPVSRRKMRTNSAGYRPRWQMDYKYRPVRAQAVLFQLEL